MTTGLLVVFAIFLILVTGPVNAAVVMFMLWIISYLIQTFPGLTSEKK